MEGNSSQISLAFFTFDKISGIGRTFDDMEDQNFFETWLQGFSDDSMSALLAADADDTVPEISTKGLGVEPLEPDLVVASCSGGSAPLESSDGACAVANSTEDKLRCKEKLDRSSPELWPQDLPTAAANFLAKHYGRGAHAHAQPPPPPVGAQNLNRDDVKLLHQFGSLTSAALLEEVKKMQNMAAKLTIQENKELTRALLLGVFDDDDDKDKKK